MKKWIAFMGVVSVLFVQGCSSKMVGYQGCIKESEHKFNKKAAVFAVYNTNMYESYSGYRMPENQTMVCLDDVGRVDKCMDGYRIFDGLFVTQIYNKDKKGFKGNYDHKLGLPKEGFMTQSNVPQELPFKITGRVMTIYEPFIHIGGSDSSMVQIEIYDKLYWVSSYTLSMYMKEGFFKNRYKIKCLPNAESETLEAWYKI